MFADGYSLSALFDKFLKRGCVTVPKQPKLVANKPQNSVKT